MPAMMETPPPPAAVTGAMGGGAEKVPFAGVGSMMAGKPPGPGGASPMGGFAAAAEAVEKVVDNMATMDKEGAPFGARIKQMLQAWKSEAAKRGPGGGVPGGGAPPSAKPPEDGAKDFVG